MRRKPERPIEKGEFDISWIDTNFDPTSLDTPERIVAYCKNAGFINGDYMDIEAVIASNPELKLVYEDLGADDAYIVKNGEKDFTISVNSRHHKNRQRFSMAHEYIHYQVHRDRISKLAVGERILYRNSHRDYIEYQANRYAGEILMPDNHFRRAIGEFGGRISALADRFGVSQEAVRVRADQLGFPIVDA